MTNRTYALCVALTIADEAGDSSGMPLLLTAEITVDAAGDVGTIMFPNALPMPLDLLLQDAIRELRFDDHPSESTASPESAHFDWVISIAIDPEGNVQTEKLLSARPSLPADVVPLFDGSWPGAAHGGRAGLRVV